LLDFCGELPTYFEAPDLEPNGVLDVERWMPPVAVGFYLAATLGKAPLTQAAKYIISIERLEFCIVQTVTCIEPVALFLPLLS
jgi:TRAP-type C4-dicarboxylate transport system permease large subunit